MFKETLRQIAKNDYVLPEGADVYTFVLQVAEVLGSPDPELRDELGYTILSKWILDKKLLRRDQLAQLLRHALSDEMLFNRIGETETDSVFLRSFSSLLVALLLIRNNQDGYLNQASMKRTIHRLVSYCRLEKDLRGYVERKGWAHAAAHVADAVDECVRNPYAGLEDCRFLFGGLTGLLDHAPHVFTAEEDERIATAVTAMVELGKVPVSAVCEWLSQIELPAAQDVQSRYRRINYKHFVRSLWIRLQEKGLLAEDHQLIAAHNRFHPFRNI